MSVAIVANLDCNVVRSDGLECLHKIRNRPAYLISNWQFLNEPKTLDGRSDIIGLINIACFAVLSNDLALVANPPVSRRRAASSVLLSVDQRVYETTVTIADLIPLREVSRRVGLGKTMIYNMIAEIKFDYKCKLKRTC